MDEVTSNYASALFSLSQASLHRKYLEALEGFNKLLVEEPAFYAVLRSYNVSKKEKEELIDQASRGYGLPALTNFIKVVSSHHRISSFEKIVKAYASLLNEEEGVKEGIAYSAEKLSKEQLSSIEEALEKKLSCKVKLANRVEETLLGGVKVAIDGKVYDGSLRNKLLELQKTLKRGGKSL